MVSIIGVFNMTEEDSRIKSICIRFPWYLWEELIEITHQLKRRSPDYKWSANQVVCEALRQWIIAAKKKIGG
jgi:hypothetical protein